MSKDIVESIKILNGGNLLELKTRIDDYISKGYTRFDTEIERGWYDDIDEISLEIKK